MVNQFFTLSSRLRDFSDHLAISEFPNHKIVDALDCVGQAFVEYMDLQMEEFIHMAKEYKAKPNRTLKKKLQSIVANCEPVSDQVKRRYPDYAEIWDELTCASKKRHTEKL